MPFDSCPPDRAVAHIVFYITARPRALWHTTSDDRGSDSISLWTQRAPHTPPGPFLLGGLKTYRQLCVRLAASISCDGKPPNDHSNVRSDERKTNQSATHRRNCFSPPRHAADIFLSSALHHKNSLSPACLPYPKPHSTTVVREVVSSCYRSQCRKAMKRPQRMCVPCRKAAADVVAVLLLLCVVVSGVGYRVAQTSHWQQ